MFKNTYQSGLLSIFYSIGSNPLSIWDSSVMNGHIKRLTDEDVNSLVLEIVSTNVATTYITCPRNNKNLGIRLPFLVMIIKNLKRYFSFEVTILDDKNLRRRFRTSNFQSTTKIKPFCTTMPIGLTGGWNQIQFNLADFTRRAYGTQYIETLQVQIHANARIRRVYFSERLYPEDQLPQDYKLYLPLGKKERKRPKVPEKPAEPPKETAQPEVVVTMEPEVVVTMEPVADQVSIVEKEPRKVSKVSVTSIWKPPSTRPSVLEASEVHEVGAVEEAGEVEEAGDAQDAGEAQAADEEATQGGDAEMGEVIADEATEENVVEEAAKADDPIPDQQEEAPNEG